MNQLSLFMTAFNAVAPVVSLILLGYFLKQKGLLSKEFLRQGNWLVFHVCLPCMLFINVYDIAGFSAINWSIVLYCTAMAFLIFLLGLGAAVTATKDPRRRGVVWQCTFRSNFAIIGISLAGALAGDEAVAISAVISAFSIPLFNVLAVIALSVFTRHKGSSLRCILVNILHNPLLIGIALGMACLGLREGQRYLFGEVLFSLQHHTKFLYTTLNYLKALTTPLALIILGGQFEFTAVRELRREIAAGTLWRTVISPLLGVGGAIALSDMGILSCGSTVYPALIALFGSPVAVSSAIMAGSMDNDEQLATQLVVWTSLLSVPTVFLQVYLLLSLGFLNL